MNEYQALWWCFLIFLYLSLPQDYGHVPSYLEQRRQEMAEAQADYDRYVQESLKRGEMDRVSATQRYVSELEKVIV